MGEANDWVTALGDPSDWVWREDHYAIVAKKDRRIAELEANIEELKEELMWWCNRPGIKHVEGETVARYKLVPIEQEGDSDD